MRNDDCFDVSTYQRMAAGQLPADEMEKVYAHLESCDRCFRMVQKLPEDKLVASMRAHKWPANAVEPAFVNALAQKILKQGENRGQESLNVIVFSCPGCRNKLKVKNELAGQKVKCPKCGKVMQIPMPVAKFAPSAPATRENTAEADTVPPKDVRTPDVMDALTVPPVEARTLAPVQKDVTNVANRPDATHGGELKNDPSLTDFLAPPQQPDEIGRLGIYRVLKVLGAGGMGVVFKAEDPGLKRFVAIKAMLPAIAASASAKSRFLREAQAAAGVKHIHIVTIHQVGEDRGVPFLAMEFLKGEPLDERLKRETILPLAETLRIGREMAEGLAAAHEQGLIHRDIKPANTWLEASPASPGRKSGQCLVKILDFGLARPTDDQAHLTQSGAIIGTPAFMSPEQARGEKLDARCDLWSLGVVLYRMCTGDVPFKGADTVSTLMAVAMNNPLPPKQVNPKVPIGLSNLVMKLLEKDRAKRLASAHEVVEALRELEQGRLAIAGPSTKSGRVTQTRAQTGAVGDRKKSRKRVMLAIVGILAIVAGTVVFWPAREVIGPKGNTDLKDPPDTIVKISPPPILPSAPKTLTENDIKVDFSYFEELGLKVKDFAVAYDRTVSYPPYKGSEGSENKLYRMQFLMRFDKDLSANELKEVAAAFDSSPGSPSTGRGQSYFPGLPAAPAKVIYWFYDKDKIAVAQVYGRPTKVEGLISGKKDDVFRVIVERVSFSVGFPSTYIPLEMVKRVVVRPIEKTVTSPLLETSIVRDGKAIDSSLNVDFSYFERLGLRLKDFSMEHEKTLKSKDAEHQTYRIKLLLQFDKNLSGDELKEVKAAFNSYPGTPGSPSYGWGKSYSPPTPGIPAATATVTYCFYDKDNISVAEVYGRPLSVEGPITGVKDNAFRVRFDPIRLAIGSPPRAVALENVKRIEVRPIEKTKN